MKYLFSLVLLAIIYPVITLPAFAAGVTTCVPSYGQPYGGECPFGNLIINKTVQNPTTKDFVDNLGVNDPKFKADSIVSFNLTITNTGNATINSITVQDVFPQFVSFNAGAGNFDAKNKTLTFTVDSLKANESKTFGITGKVVSESSLPDNQALVCVVNQATAMGNGQTAQDNAQLCIEKKVLGGVPLETKGGLKVFQPTPTKKAPPTGPEALVLAGLIPTGFIGHLLRKKTSK